MSICKLGQGSLASSVLLPHLGHCLSRNCKVRGGKIPNHSLEMWICAENLDLFSPFPNFNELSFCA